MMILGKLIGGGLGWLIAGPLGLLLGLAVGHMFDKGYAQIQAEASPERRREIEQTFFDSVFRLLGHLAKADGRVSEEEVAQTEAYMTEMGLTDEHRRAAIDQFKEGVAGDFDPQAQIETFRSVCGRRANLVRMLLTCLIHIALADGELDEREVEVLRQVALGLGLSEAMFEQMLRMIRAQSQFGGQQAGGAGPSSQERLQQAYEALGVSSEASDAQVKKAYRKLMSQHHPDKLIGQGMPEDMIKEANERSDEIRKAYELIRQSRDG